MMLNDIVPRIHHHQLSSTAPTLERSTSAGVTSISARDIMRATPSMVFSMVRRNSSRSGVRTNSIPTVNRPSDGPMMVAVARTESSPCFLRFARPTMPPSNADVATVKAVVVPAATNATRRT